MILSWKFKLFLGIIIVVQSFLNLGCNFCDICQFIFRDMGYFKGDWLPGIALPGPQIYLVSL